MQVWIIYLASLLVPLTYLIFATLPCNPALSLLSPKHQFSIILNFDYWCDKCIWFITISLLNLHELNIKSNDVEAISGSVKTNGYYTDFWTILPDCVPPARPLRDFKIVLFSFSTFSLAFVLSSFSDVSSILWHCLAPAQGRLPRIENAASKLPFLGCGSHSCLTWRAALTKDTPEGGSQETADPG